MSARPSVRMEQLGSHWTDFHEIWHLSVFRKSVEKIQVSLKSDKNKGNLTWYTGIHFRSYLAHFFLEWKLFWAEVVERLETHILCSVTFFENRTFYEITWKNIVEGGRPQMIIWRMFIACWISKATNTGRLCNTHCFSTATVVAWTRFNVTLYTQCLCCWCLRTRPTVV